MEFMIKLFFIVVTLLLSISYANANSSVEPFPKLLTIKSGCFACVLLLNPHKEIKRLSDS
jgi:hypothetical protein